MEKEKRNAPTIVVNLKTYKYGEDVLMLAKEIEKVDKEIDNEIIVGCAVSDISEISEKTDLNVYSQHSDPVVPGRNTGYIVPEAVKSRGAIGSFLNHSEHKLDIDVIKNSIERCREAGLKTMVFAGSIEEAKKVEEMSPDYLVFEPPELVAGETSVSKARPELIEKVSKTLNSPFLVGAGIKTNEDVVKAIDMGSSGFALASGVCKAENPREVLKNLAV